MLLVVDANVVIAAVLSRSGITNNLIFSPKLEFIAPEFIEKELDKYFPDIVEKSKASEEEVRLALKLVFSRMKIVSSEEYESWKGKAKESCPDPKDAEYFAVAFAFNCPLWSNDKRLKSQSEVKVLSTSELRQFLS